MTLAEAKRHLRLEEDETDEDELISGLISAAREYAEDRQWKRLAKRKFETQSPADLFFRLPAPCQSIESVSFTDSEGAMVVISPSFYTLYSDNFKADLFLSSFKYPPLRTTDKYPVRIEFTAGMQPEEVPRKTKIAILMLVGHWYETREATTEKKREKPPFAVDALLDMDRTW
ncbi:hypothetical protein BSK66_25530 [Paenibacillus odorifer]|nr:hypothetical protein C171_28512 [Paenibacillus sp. FSL H8-237]OME50204.1 hypothetical protein BSK66_25530 [Paenibacillus odorifer]